MSIGETYLTMQGWVGSEVKFKEVNTGVALASFRLGSSPRQFDRSKGAWVDRPTTWFTVECWRTLAQNVHRSLNRGDPVIVNARLKTTEWTEDGEPRSRLVLDAISVGHDLSRGTTKFTKNQPIRAASTGGLEDHMRDLSTEAETTDPATPDETPYTTPEAA
jgi:single-strand DNA-binding protein